MKNKERINNVNLLQEKLNNKISIFDAIDGNKVNTKDFEVKINYPFKFKGQIGCYLSHYYLYKQLLNSTSDYTVIFEDDAEILVDNLNEILEKIVNTEFDMIFLGYNVYKNNTEPFTLHQNGLFTLNTVKKIWGTHGYIINNKSIQKILSLLKVAENEIDLQLYKLIKKGLIKGYFCNPVLVSHRNFSSLVQYSPIIKKDSNKNFLYIVPRNKIRFLKK
jgi:GR25 family glycosyltransferase involved in LPS biosynthesis